MSKAKYSKLLSNVLKDLPDERDFIYSPIKTKAPLPEKYINTNIQEIENQYSLGSCVANACVSSLEMMHTFKKLNLSRLFMYYNLRKDYANLIGKDIGSYTRDAYKYANKYGICSEEAYPYIIENVHNVPPQEAYDAANFKVLKYERINKIVNDVKDAVFKNNAVIISMQLGKTFYSVKGPLDKQNYKAISATNTSIGGHAMSVVGWDLNGFIIENSWGDKWGDKGLFLLKYDVFDADVWDIWTATEITTDKSAPSKLTFLDKIKNFFKGIFNYVKTIPGKLLNWF